MNFLKTTLIGGLLFLVPLMVLGVVIGKAIGFMLVIAEPMANFVPMDSLGKKFAMGSAITSMKPMALPITTPSTISGTWTSRPPMMVVLRNS